MAAFNFPNSPSTNDLHTENGVTYKWNGTVWKRQNASYTDSTNLNVTGIATFAGAVSIGGVLTYEDVKNVDSVGVITARSGLSVTAGDVVIPDKIIHSGDTNTAIRFPEADNFTVECAGAERFRVKPTNDVAVFTGSNSGTLTIRNDTSNEMQIHSGSSDALILGSGGENERLRIRSGGEVAIGGAGYAGQPFSVQTSTTNLGYMQSTGTTRAVMAFADANSSVNVGYGCIGNNHVFMKDGAEKVRIDSSGKVGIGTDDIRTTSAATLEIGGVGGTPTPHLTLRRMNTVGNGNDLGIICFAGDGPSAVNGNRYGAQIYAAGAGTWTGSSYPADLIFRTTPSGATTPVERIRIQSDGDVVIGSGNGGAWQFPKALNVQGPTGAIVSLYNGDTTTYAADTNASIELKLKTGDTGNQTGAVEIRGFKEEGTNGNNARAISFWTAGNGGTNAERLRITSAGNVTTTGTSTFDRTDAGFTARNGDCVSITRAGGTPLEICRTSSQGNMINFFDTDGTTQRANIGLTQNDLVFGVTSERVRINTSGELLVNHGSSDGGGKIQAFADNQDGVDILSYSTTDTHGGRLTFYRSKNATVGSNTEVADGDSLGRIDWRGYNDDGTAYNQGARIEAFVSGDVDSSTDMPTDLVFKTSANGSATPTERLRITSEGYVQIKYAGSATTGSAPLYVGVTGKSNITYGGGNADTACLRIEDEGSTDSYYHGIEFRTKNSGDARIYAQDMGSDAVDLVFATDNTGIVEQLRIKADGTADFNSNTVQKAVLKNYTETIKAIGNTGTSTTLDLADGNVFTATLNGNCTFTFTTGTNSAPNMQSFSLILSNDSSAGRTITWPAAVKWPNNSIPSRTTAASKTDIWSFMSPDNGTTWYGNIALYNFT